MGKTKTSEKRRGSSKSMPKKTHRLKRDIHLPTHDPSKILTNEKLVAQAFWECLRDNDPEGAAEIIAVHVNALNKSRLAKEEEITRVCVSGKEVCVFISSINFYLICIGCTPFSANNLTSGSRCAGTSALSQLFSAPCMRR